MPTLTIIHTGKPERTLDELVDYGERMGINVEVVRISDDLIASGAIEEFGDGILWRLSDIDIGGAAAFYSAIEDKETINPALYKFPQLADKFFQQSMLRYSSLRNHYIDTLRVNGAWPAKKYVEAGKLRYPFVVKPARGYSGNGVKLIKSPADLASISNNFVAQSYVPNTGEWRVFVVGGVGIGAMRKVAADGQPFNFVTSDAHIFCEDDPEVLSELNKIACRAASFFSLGCTGVDIVRNKNTGEYKIFEVNLSPGWQNGWDTVTGESVPKEVMSWYQERWNLDPNNSIDALRNYLNNRITRLTPNTQEKVKAIMSGNLSEDVKNNLSEHKAKIELHHKISPLGNFLVDSRSHTKSGLSTAHNLEDCAETTATYIKICELLGNA
ncbi:MAG: hypothetical protein LBT19_00090 [Candidatus Nomurabacteria bacterium]|jgi:hypothetical protein|nr:hypothetical protein [Candidatus Nomurabacteria bacterium]